MYQKIAEDIFGAQNETQLSTVIESHCMHIFEPEITAFYTLDSETKNFSRVLFRAIDHSNFDELPITLAIDLIQIQSDNFLYFEHSKNENSIFAIPQLAQYNYVLIPIFVKYELYHFMICLNPLKIQNAKDKIALISFLVNTANMKAENFYFENKNLKLKEELQKGNGNSIARMQILNEKLRKSNKELKQFAYQASHDFQEPLRMITTYIDLFYKKFGETLSSDGSEYLTFARNGAARLSSLVRDLLTYAKLESSDETSEQFDGNKMIHNVLENLQVAIRENKAFVFYTNFPNIIGNESEISRLFQNVIDNGIKYKGENDPIIFIDYSDDGQFHKFSIIDNGIGVAQEHQQKIFDFFTRLHSKEEYSGTGLGLSISKKIAEKHGGNISMTSNPGNGSNFMFSIKKAMH